jgi:hypothetical protein
MFDMDPQSLINEYRRTRYLREVHSDVLERRFHDLAANLWSTDASGAIVPVGQDNWDQLIRRIADVRIEQSIRSGVAAFRLNGKDIAFEAAAAYQQPHTKSQFLQSTDYFVKFGKRVHLIQTLDEGVLRIAPASAYNDPSLNPAQTDEELEHFAVTPNEQILFKLHGIDGAGKEVDIPARPIELFRYMMIPDFYVWCCGCEYYPRLFQDFEADAALVIRDRREFTTRLSAAVNQTIPGAALSEGRVSYYDPYTVRREGLVPIFSKHFRYLYQNEYRFAWTLSDNHALQPFFSELGSLRDIAELIELG